MTSSSFADRLAALRAEILSLGLDGFLVPMADEYQSEYAPPSAQRIAFLTGFTGSSAFVAVLKDKAAFFTDSRYTLQAATEVSAELYALFDTAEKTPLAWLEEQLGTVPRVGYDAWLHTVEGAERLKKTLNKKGGEAVAVSRNLVDKVWGVDRPLPPAEPVYPYDLSYAGKSSAAKRMALAEELKKKNIGAAVICDPASVAWLLNLRGGDIPHTPLPLSRVVLREDATAWWFVDPRKVTESLPAHLGDQVEILSPEDFAPALENLAHQKKLVLIDSADAASKIVDDLRAAGAAVEFGEDPCALPKACKNPVELDGMRAAHRRDGAALVSFLAWLDKNWKKNALTERSAADRLAAFREASNLYRGPSFDTISGVGEHGAIVHYRATRESDGALAEGQLYLLDSGGQYLDGTTDVTRTLALGEPLAEMRDRYTRVLKGHVALAAIRFPEGTTGAELDILARQYLWEVGLDYGHGTGHGVGSYLGVHEGPQSISKRSKVPLKPGMVVSNEPGFYKNGHYGIRIENLQAVVEIVGLAESERKILGFETLTLAPFDRRLIDIALLTPVERRWIDAYHQRVEKVLRPMLDEATMRWLEAATLPLE